VFGYSFAYGITPRAGAIGLLPGLPFLLAALMVVFALVLALVVARRTAVPARQSPTRITSASTSA
jgi:hypothetical protein